MSDVQMIDPLAGGDLSAHLETLLDPSEPLLTQMANMSAFLYWVLQDVNWVGFYLRENDRLLLGPFQGRPACTVIAMGKGVCGTAALERRTVSVPDVHSFPGHIACDPDSRSEVVVPLAASGSVWGVLDVDSPLKGRFSGEDVATFERCAALLTARAELAGGVIFPLDTLF